MLPLAALSMKGKGNGGAAALSPDSFEGSGALFAIGSSANPTAPTAAIATKLRQPRMMEASNHRECCTSYGGNKRSPLFLFFLNREQVISVDEVQHLVCHHRRAVNGADHVHFENGVVLF